MIRRFILNALYFSGVQTAFAPWTRGMGTIVSLQHVRNLTRKTFDPNFHMSVSPEFLDTMISRQKRGRYRFISMDEVAQRLENPDSGIDKSPFLSMTFDNGYRDILKNALPVFRKHEIPYTIYVSPGMIEGEVMLWHDDLERIIAGRDNLFVDLPGGRSEFDVSSVSKKYQVYRELVEYLILKVDEDIRRQIISDLSTYYSVGSKQHLQAQILGWDEINDLANDPLCTIGASTIGHLVLSKLEPKNVLYEMRQSAEILKAETGKRPEHFAYSYGFAQSAGSREFKLAGECGFKTAVTGRHGVVYRAHSKHMMALPRINMNGHHQSMRYIETMLSGVPGRFRRFGRKLDVA